MVFQWTQGALPISRRPLRQQPRVRTILVLVPVSSMKTSFLACLSLIVATRGLLGQFDPRTRVGAQ